MPAWARPDRGGGRRAGPPASSRTFRRHVAEVRDCLGGDAKERRRRAVNRPGAYAARFFRLANTEVRVSLWHEAEQGRAVVFVGGEAPGAAEP